MLADQPTVTVQLQQQQPATHKPRRYPRPRGVRVERLLAFAGAAAVLLVYALRGGGSYDLVTFEEQGLAVWWVLALGLALGLLPRRRPSRIVLLLWAALAAYAGWTALSLLWTQSAELTTVELARSLDYLGLVVLAGCVLTRDSWRSAAAGLGFAAMLVCVISLGSRLAPGVFGIDHVAGFLRTDRLNYPFGYWNAVAAWGVMCIGLGLAWSAHDSSRVRRAAALAIVPVAGATTYLTYSRAGAIGAGIAVVLVLGVSRNRITALVHALMAAAGSALVILAIRGEPQIAHGAGTRGAGSVLGALVIACALGAATAIVTRVTGADRLRAPARLRRPLALFCGLVVVVAAAAAGPRLASRAWHSFTRTNVVSSTANPTARLSNLAGTRYLVWKAAIKAFDAHPVDGSGAGTFEFWWNQHATTDEFLRDAHNIWLQNMAELGLPGLLLIVAVAVVAVWLAVTVRVRARRGASVAAAAAFAAVMILYLVHATVDWMWESTAVTVLALAGVGILGARLARGPLRVRLPVRIALVAVAALAAVIQLPGILSTNDIRNSQAAERAGNVGMALADARSAVSAESWSASAHEQEALVLEAAGHLQRAREQESLAISRESTNYAHYLIRSRIETELGELAAAVRDYSRAHGLRPRSSVFILAPYFSTRK